MSNFYHLWSVLAMVAANASQAGGKAGDDFLHQDIIQNPLKPPDTFRPRAPLNSLLDNTNAAYSLTMAAHRENIKTGSFFGQANDKSLPPNIGMNLAKQ